jgi:two-component system chemotaxis response regulator CheY
MKMRSCLIVDDSKVIRTIAGRMVREFGFSTTEAENGEQALDLCVKELPDAVLLDWNMPVMSGIEFLRELRKLPDGSRPVVLLCTTKNDVAFISAALEAGSNEYVMKPFDNEILRSKFVMTGLL